jgi:cytochrome c-type biogenesis protein
MGYLMTFLEGFVTFISPCLLPMLPIYVSYFAGGQAGKRETMINAAGFVLGFSLLFTALGAFAGRLGGLFAEYQAVVNIVCGAVVILFGLSFMEVVRLPFLNAGRNLKIRHTGFSPSVVFGIVFSVSWTPCVGAFLGSALMLAAQTGSGIRGILLLFCFSMGLGIPFILCAVFIDRLKFAFGFIKRHMRVISRVSGALLILLGIIMALGMFPSLPPPPAADNTERAADAETAPDFTVFDIGGNAVKLSDFFGKPIVVNIWASWCPPCRAHMPDIDLVYEEMKGNVAFLMVNLTDGRRETVGSASAYIAENGYSFPVYYDTAREAVAAYGISSVPATLFIDRDGRVITEYKGRMSEAVLRANIALIYD